jgi:hypothetical protein
MSVSSALESSSIEQLILDEYGDGDYWLRLLNSKSEALYAVPIAVGDPRRKRQRPKSDEGDDIMAFFTNILGKLVSARENSISMSEFMRSQTELMELMVEMSSKKNKLPEEVINALVSKAFRRHWTF